MKPSGKFLILIFAILLAGACALLWRGYQDAAQRNSLAAAAEAERAWREAKGRTDVQTQAAAQRLEAPTPAVRPPTDAAPARPAKHLAPVTLITDEQVRQWLAAVNNPEAIRSRAAEARELTVERYANFFSLMHLSPERTEALSKLFDDKRQAAMDLAVASFENGLDPREDLDAFEARVGAAKKEIEKEIQAFLGDAGYAQYEDYNRYAGLSVALTRLGRTLGGTPDALTSEQTGRLQQLLLKIPNGLITPDVIVGAKSFLSAPQLQTLQDAAAAQEAVAHERILQALPPSTLPGK